MLTPNSSLIRTKFVVFLEKTVQETIKGLVITCALRFLSHSYILLLAIPIQTGSTTLKDCETSNIQGTIRELTVRDLYVMFFFSYRRNAILPASKWPIMMSVTKNRVF